MQRHPFTLSLLAVVGLAHAASAQRAPRPLGATTASSTDPFVQVTSTRALPGGLVIANDVARRRLVLLDSNLVVVRVIVDSTSNSANSYGTRPGGLIAYRGDSTLFVDPTGLSMLVIDPKGNIARVMSVPRTQDATALVGMGGGLPAFDAAGRLLYRAPNIRMPMIMGPGGPGGGGAAAMTPPPQPDTAAIVRIDLATRKLDTAAFVKIPKPSMSMTSSGGATMMLPQINPLPLVDEWAVLDDGTVAIVRGRDYHVDWIGADGRMTSSPKIAFDWQRMSDEDKTAFIDSAKKSMDAARAAGSTAGTNQVFTNSGPVVMSGSGGMSISSSQTIVMGGGGGGGGGSGTTFGGPGGAALGNVQLEFVSPSELPDYKPPFGNGSVRADRDGNLWVRIIPTKPSPGGPVYDVIDRQGALIDRVQVPTGRTIVGFGPGGVVYMLARTDFGIKLERGRAK